MKMACRFYQWYPLFESEDILSMKYFEIHNLFLPLYYREDTMKSVKLNSFISLAGQIMEFLTMPQACFRL